MPGRLLRHLAHLVLLSWIRFLGVVGLVTVLIAGSVLQGDLHERQLDHERWVADGQRIVGDGYSFRVPSAWRVPDLREAAATYHQPSAAFEYATVRVTVTHADPARLRASYLARVATRTGVSPLLAEAPTVAGEPALGTITFGRSHAGEMLTVLVRFVQHAGTTYVITATIDQALGFKAQGVLNDMLGTWEWADA